MTSRPDRTVLARRDPAVLLAATLLVPLALLGVRQPGPVLLLWLTAMLTARVLAGVPWRRLALGQLPFAAFGASLVCVNAVTRGSEPRARVVTVVGPLEITDVGLSIGGAFALRTLLIGVCALAFLQVVDPGRLLRSLHQVARMPIRFTVALMAALRVLEDLPAEWQTVRQAHALRAPVPDSHRVMESAVPERQPRLPGTPRAMRQAAFALLVTGIRRSEQMSVALELRALGALARDERSVWRPARPNGKDAVLVVVVLLACGLVAVATT